MEDAAYTPPEVVDEDGRPLPAPREQRELDRSGDAVLVAPVAAATGGIVVGLATMMIVRGLRHRPKRVRVGGRRRGKALEVTATRSFLVDVHVLKR
ncbi:MAG TPA: hypothetical protein VHF45_06535 [Thermoleophilaceae bacterium]|nr:hypothetical protein [Thermoleophilaceae bacterium]